MNQTVFQAFNGYRQLIHFKRFRRREILLKCILLPFVLILFTALFLLTWVLFFIERITAPLFKLFVRFHLKVMVLRAKNAGWTRRFVNALTVLVSLFFAPIVVVYYVSILLKTLGKTLMREIILKMDYSACFTHSEIRLFDDRETADSASFETLFKDMDQSEAFGQMLAQYFEGDEAADSLEELNQEIIEPNDKNET